MTIVHPNFIPQFNFSSDNILTVTVFEAFKVINDKARVYIFISERSLLLNNSRSSSNSFNLNYLFTKRVESRNVFVIGLRTNDLICDQRVEIGNFLSFASWGGFYRSIFVSNRFKPMYRLHRKGQQWLLTFDQHLYLWYLHIGVSSRMWRKSTGSRKRVVERLLIHQY